MSAFRMLQRRQMEQQELKERKQNNNMQTCSEAHTDILSMEAQPMQKAGLSSSNNVTTFHLSAITNQGIFEEVIHPLYSYPFLGKGKSRMFF
jgi:hypothetical protein